MICMHFSIFLYSIVILVIVIFSAAWNYKLWLFMFIVRGGKWTFCLVFASCIYFSYLCFYFWHTDSFESYVVTLLPTHYYCKIGPYDFRDHGITDGITALANKNVIYG